jgi:hypothetical protein
MEILKTSCSKNESYLFTIKFLPPIIDCLRASYSKNEPYLFRISQQFEKRIFASCSENVPFVFRTFRERTKRFRVLRTSAIERDPYLCRIKSAPGGNQTRVLVVTVCYEIHVKSI